ncbi:HEAT repeat domain-containing protein [Nocardia stercoris]|uniref:HEAT repeat domain-containing protein n=1 Tax=Nocardia stercoris TaxID=2483361 RepID=A0A3M2L5V4_9NOCA|nr:HEAT repeat domain-containing protein [Nocardia stercoris]RMI29928.1 HEAT repeat domain-containing protein [Nocardia stercoris]
MSDNHDALHTALQAPDPAARIRALNDTALQPDPACLPEVLPLLADSDIGVRAAAARTAAKVGATRPETTGAALLPLLADSDEMVRNEAVEGFGPLQYAPALPRLLTLVRSDGSWIVRASAAEALGFYQGPGVAETLAEVVNDDREMYPVRSYAAFSLGHIGDPAILPQVDQLIVAHGSEPKVGAALLGAGYRLGGHQYLAPLLNLLDINADYEIGRLLTEIDYLTRKPLPPTLTQDAATIRAALDSLADRLPNHAPKAGAIVRRLPLTDTE